MWHRSQLLHLLFLTAFTSNLEAEVRPGSIR